MPFRWKNFYSRSYIFYQHRASSIASTQDDTATSNDRGKKQFPPGGNRQFPPGGNRQFSGDRNNNGNRSRGPGGQGGPQGRGGPQRRGPGGGGGGGGQPSLKLENPMKVQRIAVTPPPRPPRREQGDGGNNRNQRGPPRDRDQRGPPRDQRGPGNSRPGASASGGPSVGGDSEYESDDKSNRARRYDNNDRYDGKSSEEKIDLLQCFWRSLF